MSEHPLALHRAAADYAETASQVAHATHFSPDKQVVFLQALALWGSVRAACRAVPAAPQTVYRHRRASRDFALLWDAALLAARPHVEDVLGDRALNGIEEVIYYHGEEIGRRRRFDSRLLLAHLARLDRVEACDETAELAYTFDVSLERLRRGEAVGALAHGDDAYDDAHADAPGAFDPDRPEWMDERRPFVDRVAAYLADCEACDAAEGGAGGQGDGERDLPDPFDCTYDEDTDDYEYEAEEDFDASKYILRKPSQDRVTPVTLQQDEGGQQDERGQPDDPDRQEEPGGEGAPAERGAAEPGLETTPETALAPEPAPEPRTKRAAPLPPADPEPGPRLWSAWRPIHDGRMQPL